MSTIRKNNRKLAVIKLTKYLAAIPLLLATGGEKSAKSTSD